MPQSKQRPIIIDGANELSPRGAMWVVRRWNRLKREMVNSDGYLWHHIYFVFPFTLGLTSHWKDKRSAHRFAQMPVHKEFWKWAEENPKLSKGGWLAIYEYRHGGALWGTGVKAVRKHFDAALTSDDEEEA